MRHIRLPIVASALMVIGVLGLALLGSPAADTLTRGAFTSNGQRIYYTGADSVGPIPRTSAGGTMGFGMMGNSACVGCHGEDGRGGRVGMMLGTLDIPDIRYASLTATRADEGTSSPPWTEADISRAIRDGVEPNGQALKSPMPRWAMSDADLADVIAYLKELSTR
jgi:cytochrome c oxidase subunit 2